MPKHPRQYESMEADSSDVELEAPEQKRVKLDTPTLKEINTETIEFRTTYRRQDANYFAAFITIPQKDFQLALNIIPEITHSIILYPTSLFKGSIEYFRETLLLYCGRLKGNTITSLDDEIDFIKSKNDARDLKILGEGSGIFLAEFIINSNPHQLYKPLEERFESSQKMQTRLALFGEIKCRQFSPWITKNSYAKEQAFQLKHMILFMKDKFISHFKHAFNETVELHNQNLLSGQGPLKFSFQENDRFLLEMDYNLLFDMHEKELSNMINCPSEIDLENLAMILATTDFFHFIQKNPNKLPDQLGFKESFSKKEVALHFRNLTHYLCIPNRDTHFIILASFYQNKFLDLIKVYGMMFVKVNSILFDKTSKLQTKNLLNIKQKLKISDILSTMHPVNLEIIDEIRNIIDTTNKDKVAKVLGALKGNQAALANIQIFNHNCEVAHTQITNLEEKLSFIWAIIALKYQFKDRTEDFEKFKNAFITAYHKKINSYKAYPVLRNSSDIDKILNSDKRLATYAIVCNLREFAETLAKNEFRSINSGIFDNISMVLPASHIFRKSYLKYLKKYSHVTEVPSYVFDLPNDDKAEFFLNQIIYLYKEKAFKLILERRELVFGYSWNVRTLSAKPEEWSQYAFLLHAVLLEGLEDAILHIHAEEFGLTQCLLEKYLDSIKPLRSIQTFELGKILAKLDAMMTITECPERYLSPPVPNENNLRPHISYILGLISAQKLSPLHVESTLQSYLSSYETLINDYYSVNFFPIRVRNCRKGEIITNMDFKESELDHQLDLSSTNPKDLTVPLLSPNDRVNLPMVSDGSNLYALNKLHTEIDEFCKNAFARFILENLPINKSNMENLIIKLTHNTLNAADLELGNDNPKEEETDHMNWYKDKNGL